MTVIEMTKVVVRMDGTTQDLNLNLPGDFTDEGLKEIVAQELQCDAGKLVPLTIERSSQGITLREGAPWG